MQKIDISNSTIIRFILIILGFWFLYFIRDVLVLLFLVLIIVAGLAPIVDRWAIRITRPGAVISLFVVIFLSLVIVFSILIPPLVVQMQKFANDLPAYTEQLSRSRGETGIISTISDYLGKNIDTVSSQLSNVGSTLLSRTLGVINGVVAFITVLVLVFYLLLEEQGLRRIFKGLVPEEWHDSFTDTTKKIAAKLGAWIRGQLLLMASVGIATTVGLLIVGSQYSLTLGLWAGLTEIIPYAGPFLGAVPGIAVGLAQSPLQGFLTLIVYLLVQQLENNFLVPKIMAKAVGLNPIVVIIAILVGGKLYGLMGVLLSVPAAAVISVLAEDWPLVKETFSAKRR